MTKLMKQDALGSALARWLVPSRSEPGPDSLDGPIPRNTARGPAINPDVWPNEAKLAADVAERASRTNEPSIDLRVLDEFRVLMGSALAEALECYLADTPVQLSDMSSALVNDDHVALQRCAHSLKSTCATVGAMELKSLAERIEAHARARNSCSDAKALTAAALASFEKVKSHFQALIASERAGVPAGVVAVAQR